MERKETFQITLYQNYSTAHLQFPNKQREIEQSERKIFKRKTANWKMRMHFTRDISFLIRFSNSYANSVAYNYKQ